MNLFKKGLLFTFSSLFMFTSCTEQEKRFAHDEFGKEHAFFHTKDQHYVASAYFDYKPYKLVSNDITFYYDSSVSTSPLFKDFKKVFEYFGSNKWKINIDVKFVESNKLGDKAFTIRYVDASELNNEYDDYDQIFYGEAKYTNKEIENDAKIDGANVRITNALLLPHKRENRVCTILHEIGHVFGLCHISKKIGVLHEKTVMMQDTNFSLEEYTEFDLGNLEWAYKLKPEPAPSTSKPTAPSRNNPPPRNYVFDERLMV